MPMSELDLSTKVVAVYGPFELLLTGIVPTRAAAFDEWEAAFKLGDASRKSLAVVGR